jgi:hypothetical protein
MIKSPVKAPAPAEEEPQPWKVKNRGKTLAPPAKVSNEVLAQNECDAFSWCVKGLIDQKAYDRLPSYMGQWWVRAFGVQPLPEGDIRANDLFQMIRYELWAQGARRLGVSLPESVKQRHAACGYLLSDRARALKMMPERTRKLFEYEDDSEFGKVIITFPKQQEEDGMVKAKSTSASKNLSKETKPAAVKKTLVGKKKEKGPSATGYARELLIKRKHTDDQIKAMILKRFADLTEKQVSVYVSIQRSNLNREEFGYKGPKIEQIKAE